MRMVRIKTDQNIGENFSDLLHPPYPRHPRPNSEKQNRLREQVSFNNGVPGRKNI
jgi:hypothetical protein